MHEGFKQIGFKIGNTQTPIVPILIGSEAKAFLFTQRLFEEGIFATPAIYPAVRYGEAIVRTSYMATHTEEDLDTVLEIFTKLAGELGTFDDPAYARTGKEKRMYSISVWTNVRKVFERLVRALPDRMDSAFVPRFPASVETLPPNVESISSTLVH